VYFKNCHSGTPRVHPGHHEQQADEDDRGAVAGGDQQCIGTQGAEAVLADDEGHGTECAHRRYPHDPAHDLEEQFQHRFHQGDHGEAAFTADDDDRGAEEHGEAQHLQEAVAGKGADHAGRDDAQKEGARVLGRGGAGFGVEGILGERRGIDVQAGAWLDQVPHRQAENQGEKGGRREVGQRLDAYPAYRLYVADCRDAGDDHQEDQRGDDHLDELDEAVPKRPEPCADVRPGVADQDTGDDCHQNLEEQGLIKRLLRRRGCCGGPGDVHACAYSWKDNGTLNAARSPLTLRNPCFRKDTSVMRKD
jgi:hypothetical protein